MYKFRAIELILLGFLQMWEQIVEIETCRFSVCHGTVTVTPLLYGLGVHGCQFHYVQTVAQDSLRTIQNDGMARLR